MIERFQYYLDQNMVKGGSPDKEEAKSLMEKACKRLVYIKAQQISDSTAQFIFEDIYESVREGAQSLMAVKGYKPYSHEAIISFLTGFHSFPEHEISAFNRYRILRNRCVYRAANVSSTTCREALTFLEHFLPKLRKVLEGGIKGV